MDFPIIGIFPHFDDGSDCARCERKAVTTCEVCGTKLCRNCKTKFTCSHCESSSFCNSWKCITTDEKTGIALCMNCSEEKVPYQNNPKRRSNIRQNRCDLDELRYKRCAKEASDTCASCNKQFCAFHGGKCTKCFKPCCFDCAIVDKDGWAASCPQCSGTRNNPIDKQLGQWIVDNMQDAEKVSGALYDAVLATLIELAPGVPIEDLEDKTTPVVMKLLSSKHIDLLARPGYIEQAIMNASVDVFRKLGVKSKYDLLDAERERVKKLPNRLGGKYDRQIAAVGEAFLDRPMDAFLAHKAYVQDVEMEDVDVNDFPPGYVKRRLPGRGHEAKRMALYQKLAK